MPKKQKNKEPPELDITAFLNLMVVLVPFLLITAVFSRITVLNLNLPEQAGASAAADIEDSYDIEVIVRADFIEISDGTKVIATFENPPSDGAENPDDPDGGVTRYDWEGVRGVLASFRAALPATKTNATILMEDGIKYRYVSEAMDAVRWSISVGDDGAPTVYSLFPDIAFGDAP